MTSDQTSPPQPTPSPTLRTRNRITGGVIVLTGAYVVWEALTYDLGSAMRLGPGALPLALGVLFILFGLAIAIVNDDGDEEVRPLVWRPVILVLAAVLAFALLIESAGLAAATAALVLISGTADPEHSWKSLLALFVVLLVAVYVVFALLLGIPFELIAGWD